MTWLRAAWRRWRTDRVRTERRLLVEAQIQLELGAEVALARSRERARSMRLTADRIRAWLDGRTA